MIGCVCGHATNNPVYLGHLDAPRDTSIAVCRACVDKPFMREFYAEVFGPYVELRRAAWDGLNRRQRDRARSRVTVKWTKKKLDELKGEVA